MVRTMLLCGALILAFAGQSAVAASKDDVVERVSAAELQRIFGDLGYTGTEIDEDGDLFVRMQGYAVLVLVGSYDGVYISLTTAFADTTATLATVNAWNRDKRFSRAYLDNEMDPVVEAELDLAAGVTIGRIRDFIQTFGQLSLPDFVAEVAVPAGRKSA
jgi:hypothetical protein